MGWDGVGGQGIVYTLNSFSYPRFDEMKQTLQEIWNNSCGMREGFGVYSKQNVTVSIWNSCGGG